MGSMCLVLGKFRIEGSCNYSPGLSPWRLEPVCAASALPAPEVEPQGKRQVALPSCVGKVEPVEGALALGMDVRGRWILRLRGLVYTV